MNTAARIYRTRDCEIAINRVLDIGGFNLSRAAGLDPCFLDPEYPFEWAGVYELAAGAYELCIGHHDHDHGAEGEAAHGHDHDHEGDADEHDHDHEHIDDLEHEHEHEHENSGGISLESL